MSFYFVEMDLNIQGYDGVVSLMAMLKMVKGGLGCNVHMYFGVSGDTCWRNVHKNLASRSFSSFAHRPWASGCRHNVLIRRIEVGTYTLDVFTAL
jgi:hypothetical protein